MKSVFLSIIGLFAAFACVRRLYGEEGKGDKTSTAGIWKAERRFITNAYRPQFHFTAQTRLV